MEAEITDITHALCLGPVRASPSLGTGPAEWGGLCPCPEASGLGPIRVGLGLGVSPGLGAARPGQEPRSRHRVWLVRAQRSKHLQGDLSWRVSVDKDASGHFSVAG
jgi:hypothetical protein